MKKAKQKRETNWEEQYRLKQEAKQLLILLKQRENDKARNY